MIVSCSLEAVKLVIYQADHFWGPGLVGWPPLKPLGSTSMPGCLETQETQDGDKTDTETVRKRSKNYGKKKHQVTVNGVLDN